MLPTLNPAEEKDRNVIRQVILPYLDEQLKGGRRSMKSGSRFLNSRDRFGSRATEGPHRHAMSEKQPQEYSVTVEVGGKRYTGFHTVSSDIVTVDSDWSERSSHPGTSAQRTARLLLPDILRRAKVLRPTPLQNP